MSLFNPLEPPPGYPSVRGSTSESTRIASGRDRIARALSNAAAPVVLVLGPAGAGKTALVASALQEVGERFDLVIGLQARSAPLDLHDVLRKLDIYLTQRSPAYRDRVAREPLSAVHLEPKNELPGEPQRLRANLVHTLRHACILIVLDGFETNLDAARGGDALPCRDPAWDDLLAALATDLSDGRSQVLLTSRKPPLSLSAHPKTHSIDLAPVPVLLAQGEAHDPIDAVSPAARRLLWVLTRAAEPVADRLLSGVWSGESFEDEMLRQIAAALAEMPEGMAAFAPPVPPELRARLDALAGKPTPDAPPIGPLLDELARASLVMRSDQGETAAAAFVADRASVWANAHPHELAGRTDAEVWRAYGERYATVFQGLSGSELSRENSPQAQPLSSQAAEAGIRAARYLIRAGALDALFTLLGTGRLTRIADPLLFAELIGNLQSAANQMPEGELRFSLRAHLADVLHEAGQKPRALDLYAQAVEEADEMGQWAEVGRIAQNWAVALRGSGKPSVAAQVFRRAAAALRAAEQPKLNAIAVELEALRIEVQRGRAEEALPDLERHLAELRVWWRRHRAGDSPGQSFDPEALARAFTTALHLTTRADQTLERWQECLDRFVELDQVEREYGLGAYERARTRVNQCRPLLELRRMDEAQAVLEECLKEFLAAGDEARQAAALSALADLWDERGDLDQAIAIERQALAVREIITDPEARAISHQNLSSLLDKASRPEEAAGHRLAALVCRAVSGHDMGATIGSLAADIRRAVARGQRYELPRLHAVLASPDFASIRRFLEARELAVEPLQDAIDRLIEQIHRPSAE